MLLNQNISYTLPAITNKQPGSYPVVYVQAIGDDYPPFL